MAIKKMLVGMLMLASPGIFAASSKFINVDSIIVRQDMPEKVLPYAINVASYTSPITKKMISKLEGIDSNLVYSTKVKINNVIYYRLVTGNFASLKLANQELGRVKKYYPEAWLNVRQNIEKQSLAEMLASKQPKQPVDDVKAAILAVPKVVSVPVPVIQPVKAFNPASAFKQKATPNPEKMTAEVLESRKKLTTRPKIKPAVIQKGASKPDIEFAEKLLQQARQLFLDRNYARVITVSNKVVEIGSIDQKQRAMEFLGIARERQRKFAQAVAIYKQFLDLYPDSKLAPKIKIRLTGLTTMRLDPKSRLAKNNAKKAKDKWSLNGSLSQYYRDDVVESDTLGSQEVNSSLVTNINFFARRKTDKSSLVLRFDAGMVNDFIDDESDSRISRAMVNYTNNESDYQLIGGRQSRTAKGVLGRFDGFVYKGLSHESFSYSVFTGFPVQSSFDGVESERQFVGTSINFKPVEKVDMDVYLVQQEISGLTDRQALGTEFQYRNDKGFVYGIIDYDVFYSELNNVTAITNYRYSDKLVFNVTYDYRNSPLLTTLNALQGQNVESISELQDLFSDEEIYQLAEDRTSKSQNIFIGSNYQIDTNRQVYMSLSLSSIDETVESSGVAAAPATDDINISADYSQRGLLSNDDYTTLGVRLSDTSSSEIISLRARSRLAGTNGFRYDPRLHIDYRQSKTSEVNQYILKPSVKVTYKPNKKISLEASLGIEYSNFDLPELADQTQYDLFLGYVYRF